MDWSQKKVRRFTALFYYLWWALIFLRVLVVRLFSLAIDDKTRKKTEIYSLETQETAIEISGGERVSRKMCNISANCL